MSLTIALKHNGVVYMGSDSIVCRNGVKHYLTNPNSYRIFKVSGCDNMLMALDGKVVEHNVAKCSSLVPEAVAMKEEVDFEFMVNYFVPNLFEEFDARHLMCKKDDEYHCESDMIVAFKDKLFTVYADGAVIEFDDYSAIGQGYEEALGSLLSTYDIENPKERILMALRAGLANKSKVALPLVLIDTEKCEYEVYEE